MVTLPLAKTADDSILALTCEWIKREELKGQEMNTFLNGRSKSEGNIIGEKKIVSIFDTLQRQNGRVLVYSKK